MKYFKLFLSVLSGIIIGLFTMKYFKKPIEKDLNKDIDKISEKHEKLIEEADKAKNNIPYTEEQQTIGMTKEEIEKQNDENSEIQDITTKELDEIKDKFRI